MANPTEDSESSDGTRIELGPDTIHETNGGIYLDCPKCGSSVSIVQVVSEGHCDGGLSDDLAETESDTEIQDECNATLSLELLWEP